MGTETQFFSLRAFDSETKIRLIKGLLNPQINRPGNVSHFREQCIRVATVAFEVLADDLNIDGGR